MKSGGFHEIHEIWQIMFIMYTVMFMYASYQGIKLQFYFIVLSIATLNTFEKQTNLLNLTW